MKYNNPDISGWMSEGDLQWLYDRAHEMQSIVEIGSWKGRSTHALLSGCPGPVTAVDTFKGPDVDGGQLGIIRMKEEADKGFIKDIFLKNVGHFKNLKILEMKSLEAAKIDGMYDMTFIDASHWYEDVCDDIKAWLPHTRKVISGHDYDIDHVMKAVVDTLGEVSLIDSIWYKYL